MDAIETKELEEIRSLMEEANFKLFTLLNPQSKKTFVKEIITQNISLKDPKGDEFEQDFTQVKVMGHTDKALLVVKKGLQMWLAFSLIINKLEEYKEGQVYDIEVTDKAKHWLPKKWQLEEDF